MELRYLLHPKTTPKLKSTKVVRILNYIGAEFLIIGQYFKFRGMEYESGKS